MADSLEKRFEFLEHVSDAYIVAYGRSLEEAFGNAALAMFEVMVDTSTVEQKTTDLFSLETDDEYGLLYKWLETLLVKFETEMKLYSRFNVVSIQRRDNIFKLSAEAFGETYSPEKHRSRVEVKAITFHRMEIKTEQGLVSLRYILDL